MFLKNKNNENNEKSVNTKYKKKWENINFENNLEPKRKLLEEKINSLKHEIKDLYISLSILKKEKEDMEYSKDVVDNGAKYNLEDEKILMKMALVGKRMDKLTEAEFDKISNFKKLIDVKIINRNKLGF